MLPLLKKNSEKTKTELPAWHTNFRNYSVLPDTKVVRTSFFINALLVFVALGLVMAFVYQEYRLYGLREDAAGWRKRGDSSRSASMKAVAVYKKFQAEEKMIVELNNFLKGQKFALSDFLIRLSQTKPLGIVFVNFECRDTGAVIKGYAQGSSGQATGAASNYEKQLREDREISAIFQSISMTNVTRDAQAGRLYFEIILSNKPSAKAK